MNQSLFLESRNLFVNPPVDFEDWGNFDYEKETIPALLTRTCPPEEAWFGLKL